MIQGIDNVAGIGNIPARLLTEGNEQVELRGTLNEIGYLPPNPRCEVWFMKLKEAPGYMFKANIPNSAVDIMNDLYGALGTEVFFKGKNPLSIGGKGIEIQLSYANIKCDEFYFTRWTAKKQISNNI